MATHSSTIAWRIPWTEKPGGVRGVAKSRTLTLSQSKTVLRYFTSSFHTKSLKSGVNFALRASLSSDWAHFKGSRVMGAGTAQGATEAVGPLPAF